MNAIPSNSSGGILSKIEPRLRGVIHRRCGGLLAFCPGHDDRKGRSLSANVGDRGQILLRCFAGCSIDGIVAGMGLSICDLYPDTDRNDYGAQYRSHFHAESILATLAFDASVLLIQANRSIKGEPISEADLEFLAKAVTRIADAANYARGVGRGRN